MIGEKWLAISPSRAAVLRLTVAGKNPREVATELGLSTQAVYKHLNALYDMGFLARAS